MDLSDSACRAPAAGGRFPVRARGLKQAFSAGLVSVACLYAGHAAAQSEMPGLSASPTLPGAGRKVVIELRDATVYDSNVARGTESVSTIKDLRPDDILYQPSARVDLALPIGPVGIFLNGSGGYDFYQYNKALENARAEVTGGVTAHLGPCESGITGGYSVHQSDQADLGLQTTKNLQTLESYGVQAHCAEGRALAETLAFQAADLTNSASVGVIDSRQIGVNGGVSFVNKAIGEIGVQAGYSKIDYTSAATPLGLTQPGVKNYTLGLTFSRPIGQRLNGTATLSYSKLHTDGVGIPDYSTWSGRGSLSYRVNPRLQTTLSYTRAVLPTALQGFGYSVDQQIQIDGHYRLSSRFDTSAGVSWDNRDYRNPTTTPLTEVSHEDRSEVFGAVTLTLLQHASLSLDVRHTVRNTNLTVFNYKEYRVGLTAAKSF